MQAQEVCPAWEYNNVPGSKSLLAQRAPSILVWLNSLPPTDNAARVNDTRPLHEWLFKDLTPAGCEYYAGHYRGENFFCLLEYEVGIPANPLVGKPAALVNREMRMFVHGANNLLNRLDMLWPIPENIFSKPAKIRQTVEFVAALFNWFLIIHPYANGNGHMARFLAVAILSRYGLRPRQWPINARPPDPPYSTLITRYQQGDTEGFIQFLLKCI